MYPSCTRTKDKIKHLLSTTYYQVILLCAATAVLCPYVNSLMETLPPIICRSLLSLPFAFIFELVCCFCCTNILSLSTMRYHLIICIAVNFQSLGRKAGQISSHCSDFYFNISSHIVPFVGLRTNRSRFYE